MQPFNFQIVSDLGSAFNAHKDNSHSRYLAGGTNLVDLLKLHVETPTQLVDISQLKLKNIKQTQNKIQVGALVTNTELADHSLIRKHVPVLSQAILSGASPQLRNLATTSGNLLQRTRCNYFRDTACPCNKREPGSGCSAITGINRNLAVLGTSKSCIASNPSDMNVALMALEANILIKNGSNEREISISNFYRLPEDTPHIETNLEPNEIITGIEIPIHSWYTKSLYLKVRDRASYSFALTSVAVALDIQQGVVKNCRVAMGGVGTIPWRAKEAEAVLNQRKLTTPLIVKAAQTALADADPKSGNKFKVELAQRTMISAIQKCGDLT